MKKSLILLTSSISFAIFASLTLPPQESQPDLEVVAKGWEKDGFVIVVKPTGSLNHDGYMKFRQVK